MGLIQFMQRYKVIECTPWNQLWRTGFNMVLEFKHKEIKLIEYTKYKIESVIARIHKSHELQLLYNTSIIIKLDENSIKRKIILIDKFVECKSSR